MSSSAASIDNLIDYECPFCFKLPSNSVMCPQCSKLYCEECIYPWLQKKSTCPYCIVNIQPTNLIKCHWFNDLVENIKSLKRETMDLKTINGHLHFELKKKKANLKIIRNDSALLSAAHEKEQKLLQERVAYLEAIPGFEYLKEGERPIILKNQIIGASKSTLFNAVENISVTMLLKTLKLYSVLKNEKVAPEQLLQTVDQLTELLNQCTLELKK